MLWRVNEEEIVLDPFPAMVDRGPLAIFIFLFPVQGV